MTHDHERGHDRGHRPASQTVACAITGVPLTARDGVRVDMIRPKLVARMKQDHPALAPDAIIARSEVDRYRALYVQDLLREESGELSEIHRQVANSLANEATLAENTEAQYIDTRSFADRLSDHLASFGGSWRFLIAFAVFIAVWMAINARFGSNDAFDPYPFILLNLILSTLAAIQAPVIMMSQSRQEAKDRLRSLNDYRVNLKAELEIRHLHEKIDHLIDNQWQRLAEIQQLQLESMAARQS